MKYKLFDFRVYTALFSLSGVNGFEGRRRVCLVYMSRWGMFVAHCCGRLLGSTTGTAPSVFVQKCHVRCELPIPLNQSLGVDMACARSSSTTGSTTSRLVNVMSVQVLRAFISLGILC